MDHFDIKKIFVVKGSPSIFENEGVLRFGIVFKLDFDYISFFYYAIMLVGTQS